MEALPSLSFLIVSSLSSLLTLLLTDLMSWREMELCNKRNVQQTGIMVITDDVINDILPSGAIDLSIAGDAVEAVTLPHSTVATKFAVDGLLVRVCDRGGTENSLNGRLQRIEGLISAQSLHSVLHKLSTIGNRFYPECGPPGDQLSSKTWHHKTRQRRLLELGGTAVGPSTSSRATSLVRR